MIEYLLNNPIALQQYIKTTKKWNSYSFRFVNFCFNELNNIDNDFIPPLGSNRSKNVLFIGRFYGVVPTDALNTSFTYALNDLETYYTINIIGAQDLKTVANIDVPIIMDSANIDYQDNLNYNFIGYIFYSN